MLDLQARGCLFGHHWNIFLFYFPFLLLGPRFTECNILNQILYLCYHYFITIIIIIIIIIRPKEKYVLFPVTCPKFLGSVGRQTFLYGKI